MTKLAAHQPYFFPYIGYFNLIASVDVFVSLDDVSFIKRGWINKNQLLLDGKAHPFSYPVQDASQNKLIKDTVTGNEYNFWIQKFLRTLHHAYRSAPYFETIKQLVIKCVTAPNNCSISDLNFSSITHVCEYLKIPTKLISTSSGISTQTGQNRILDICKHFKADEYHNAIGGQELYSKEDFKASGVALSFIKATTLSYAQGNNDFIPGLSIIDVLMWNSPESINKMIHSYDLQ